MQVPRHPRLWVQIIPRPPMSDRSGDPYVAVRKVLRMVRSFLVVHPSRAVRHVPNGEIAGLGMSKCDSRPRRTRGLPAPSGNLAWRALAAALPCTAIRPD